MEFHWFRDVFSWKWWNFMKFHDFHVFLQISWFYEKCEILEISRFPANLAPRIHDFLLEITAILHLGRCRCRFYGVLWEFIEIYGIPRFWRKTKNHVFTKLSWNSPKCAGASETLPSTMPFRCFATKKCKMFLHLPKR